MQLFAPASKGRKGRIRTATWIFVAILFAQSSYRCLTIRSWVPMGHGSGVTKFPEISPLIAEERIKAERLPFNVLV